MTPKDNFINICNLTTKVLGLRKGSLAKKSRQQDVQIARMVAGVIGRLEEKIKYKIIADILNRDRTTIYYYEERHNANYSWLKYREAYNKVYLAYHRIENSKNVFNDPHVMREYLLKKGVKEHHKKEIKILVKSGKVGTHITTSYFDFSNQLSNIKNILIDGNYKYEIPEITPVK